MECTFAIKLVIGFLRILSGSLCPPVHLLVRSQAWQRVCSLVSSKQSQSCQAVDMLLKGNKWAAKRGYIRPSAAATLKRKYYNNCYGYLWMGSHGG